jgi:hypothetical protein
MWLEQSSGSSYKRSWTSRPDLSEFRRRQFHLYELTAAEFAEPSLKDIGGRAVFTQRACYKIVKKGRKLMTQIDIRPELKALDAAFKQPRPEPNALDVAREFIGRFVHASDAELDLLTVWIAHTYMYEAFYATPRLSVSAPVMEAGKTLTLNMIVALGKNVIKTVNASAPALFAVIDQEHPTLCFDETDNMWRASGGGGRYRDQLSILNDGYVQDGFVLRSQNGTAKRHPTFVVAAFAGIGNLPGTLASRCIPIRLQPVPDNVTLEDYEPDLFRGEAARIAEMLQTWITSRGPEIDLQPAMPEGFKSRKKQIYKVIIAIGDLAGPEWSSRIRKAAREVGLNISRTARISPAEELISLIATVAQSDAFMPTGELIEFLKFQRDIENKINWATWLSDPIIATRQLANMLRPYGIESRQKWIDSENRRGYLIEDFRIWAQIKEPEPILEPMPEGDGS